MSLYKEHMSYNRREEIFQSSEQSLVSCRETQLAMILKKKNTTTIKTVSGRRNLFLLLYIRQFTYDFHLL